MTTFVLAMMAAHTLSAQEVLTTQQDSLLQVMNENHSFGACYKWDHNTHNKRCGWFLMQNYKNGTHHWIVPKVSAVFFSVYVQPTCSTSRVYYFLMNFFPPLMRMPLAVLFTC